MRQKNKLSRITIMPVLLVMLASSSYQCEPIKISFADLRSHQQVAELFRAGLYDAVIEKLAADKKPSQINYTNSFTVAMAYSKKNKNEQAIAWYTRAAFSSLPEALHNMVDNLTISDLEKAFEKLHSDIQSEGEMKNKVSPFLGESLYELGRIANEAHKPELAKKILLLAESAGPATVTAASMLYRAENIDTRNLIEKQKLLMQSYQLSKDAYTRVKAALALQANNEDKRALTQFLSAAMSTERPWVFNIAVRYSYRLVKNSENRAVVLKELPVEQITLVLEGARQSNDLTFARSFWPMVFHYSINEKGDEKDDALPPEMPLFYGLFLYDTGAKNQIPAMIERYASNTASEERRLSAGELASVLYSRKEYELIISSIPEKYNEKKALFYRLWSLAMQKKDKSHEARQDALFYLNNFDNTERVAEKLVADQCLALLVKSEYTRSEQCFEQLAQATVNSDKGGKSRYFLGWLARQKGDDRKAIEHFSEVYLNSPASYYVFRAFEQIDTIKNNKTTRLNEVPIGGSVHTLRTYLSENGFDKQYREKWMLQKFKDRRFSVATYYQVWQSKLDDFKENATADERKAVYFIVTGQTIKGLEYLPPSMAQTDRLILFQFAALLGDDPYYKYEYLRQYMKITGQQEDIFTMDVNAIAMLYAEPYKELVKKAENRFKVSAAELYALMRKESGFNRAARSWSDARGIMQVIPSTAKLLNRKLNFNPMNLYDPLQSVYMGAYYFKDMRGIFGNDFEKIAAAYNGGPGNLRKWMRTLPSITNEVFIEYIPRLEAHYYAKLTRANYDRYRLVIQAREQTQKN